MPSLPQAGMTVAVPCSGRVAALPAVPGVANRSLSSVDLAEGYFRFLAAL
jgi:hypothetical protein